MIVYLIFPIVFASVNVSCRFLKNERLRHLLCSLIPAVLLFFLLGFKASTVGVDTKAYLNAYYDLKEIPFFPNPTFFPSLLAYNFSGEYGFIFFAQLFAKTGLPYLFFQLFVYGVICFCLFFSTWKLSKNPIASYLIFFCFTFFNFYVSGLRQSFAMSLCLLAISIIIDGGRTPIRNMLYFLFVGIAIFWHKSALIFLLSYFLIGVRIGLKGMIVLTFVSLFLYIFGAEMYEIIDAIANSLFASNYSAYAPFSSGKGLTSILLIIMIVFSYFVCTPSKAKSAIAYFFDNKVPVTRNFKSQSSEIECYNLEIVTNKNDYFSFYIIMTFIGVWLLFTNRFSIAFGRIGMYYSIFIIFLLPNAIEKINNKRTKDLVEITLFVSFFLYFIYTAVLTNYLGIGPYRLFEGTF